MRLNESVIPSNMKAFIQRFVAFGFICSLILTVALCELVIVLVELCEGTAFYVHFFIEMFLVVNIIANFSKCRSIDTSATVVKQRQADPQKLEDWRFCNICNAMAPPRSRHCNTCETCILKRDHHCLLTGTCVGHWNYRYFMSFMLYTAIGTAYATVLNIIYFWWLHRDIYLNIYRILCFLSPTLVPLQWTWDDNGLKYDWHALPTLLFSVNFSILVISIYFFLYHLKNLLSGSTSAEYKKSERRAYDLGSWRSNIEMVFGKKFYVGLLWPFISSELPHDGVHWSIQLREVTVGDSKNN